MDENGYIKVTCKYYDKSYGCRKKNRDFKDFNCFDIFSIKSLGMLMCHKIETITWTKYLLNKKHLIKGD